MAKTYWVMKNPGSTAEWTPMDGKQFYEFITSPAGKGRYFMDCDTFKIEVSPEKYREWKLEANHSAYLRGIEDDFLVLSLERLAEDNGISGDELAVDLSVNVEEEVLHSINLQRLSEALFLLKDDEQWLITSLFMADKPKTEQELAALKGVSQPAIHKQKNKILEKLKLMVIKSEKSQQ